MELKIHRGDVFYIRDSGYYVGSEMAKTRPAVIVSNEKNNQYSPLVEIVYLTTAEKKPLPTHVPISIYGRRNTVLCESVYTVSKERIESYLCTLDMEEMALVDAAILISLGLTQPNVAETSEEKGEEIPDTSEASEPVQQEAAPHVSVILTEPNALRERIILLEAQQKIYEKICASYIPNWPKGAAV